MDQICEKYATDLKYLFMSQNEKTVAVLGNDYTEEYLQTGKCSGGFAVVSDKRLYVRGNSYDVCHNMFGRKVPRENKQSKTIDLKDVTATGERTYRQNYWLNASIVHFVIGIMFLMFVAEILLTAVSSNAKEDDPLVALFDISIFITVIALIVAIIFLFLYISTKLRMITFQYNGGEIAFNVEDFSRQEIIFFQRQLSLAKDHATENSKEVKG